MTSQTKKFIEVSDILALRCECRHGKCRTSLTIPVEDVSGREMRLCPTCKESWAQLLESSYESLITEFVEKLRKLKEAEKHLGCGLTLEIKDEQLPVTK